MPEGKVKTKEELLLDKIHGDIETQLKEKTDSFKTEFKSIAEDAIAGKLGKDEITGRLDTLEESSKDFDKEALTKLSTDLTEIEKNVQETAATLKAMKETAVVPNAKALGFGDLLKKGLKDAGMLEEYVTDAANGKKGLKYSKVDDKNHTESFNVHKAAIDMTLPLAFSPGSDPGTNIGYLTTYSMRDVLIALNKDVHVLQIFPVDPISTPYMGVLVEHTYFDGAAIKTEGSAAAKSSIKFKTVEYKVFNFATYFRVSKENLKDIDRLAARLNRIAPDKINSDFDLKCLGKTGDGSTATKGILVAGNFTAFDPSTWAGEIKSANTGDLIKKMKLQAALTNEDVNMVWLHPSAIDALELLKDEDKNYLQSRGLIFDKNGNLIRVSGLFVAKTKQIAVNECIVMWSDAVEIGLREDVTVEIGLDGNDFTEGMRTIMFEFRAAFGGSKPAAVIYCDDITTDLEVLDEVVV
jgi:HK97 family phage major capsid protein